MYVSVCEFVHLNAGIRNIEFPGAGVLGGCESAQVELGTELRSSGKAGRVLNHLVAKPFLQPYFGVWRQRSCLVVFAGLEALILMLHHRQC